MTQEPSAQVAGVEPGVAPQLTEIRVKGKTVEVPSAHIQGRSVIVTGKWIKIAAVQDEDFVPGEAVDCPADFIGNLKTSSLRADIFTFAQRLPDVTPKHNYHYEWDNIAAIPVVSYDNWWKKRVSNNLRRDVKRAKDRGIVVALVPFTDEFIRGIMGIYNETPVRQGRPFWHYGKDFDTVKAETGTYLERSEFLGAFYGDELIGYLKIVRVGNLGCLMQIVSKIAHQNKWPTNSLIAKAVELCETRKWTHLTYGKFIYGKTKNSLTDFKIRNGFEQILIPRYYVPLTTRGKVVLKLGLHHGIKHLVPERLITLIAGARSRVFRKFSRSSSVQEGTAQAGASKVQGATDPP